MAASSAPSAPTIICVDCPAGANRAGFALMFAPAPFVSVSASSSLPLSRAMAVRISLGFFSGASLSRAPSVGSSILVESRSAQRPASTSSSGAALGMTLRWI